MLSVLLSKLLSDAVKYRLGETNYEMHNYEALSNLLTLITLTEMSTNDNETFIKLADRSETDMLTLETMSTTDFCKFLSDDFRKEPSDGEFEGDLVFVKVLSDLFNNKIETEC